MAGAKLPPCSQGRRWSNQIKDWLNGECPGALLMYCTVQQVLYHLEEARLFPVV